MRLLQFGDGSVYIINAKKGCIGFYYSRNIKEEHNKIASSNTFSTLGGHVEYNLISVFGMPFNPCPSEP